MSASLDGKLVVAISSRALFDFEQENEVFEQGDDRAYMALQLEKLDIPAKPGVAFSLVKKLLAFNHGATPSNTVRPSITACRSSAAASRVGSHRGATSNRCTPTCF
jgi:5'-nucleotidase